MGLNTGPRLCLCCGSKDSHISTLRIAMPSTSRTTQIAKPMYCSGTDTSSTIQMGQQFASNATCKEPVTLIPPDTPPTDAVCPSSLTMERCNALASELYRITTPCKAKGFRIALEENGLTSRYPNIVTDIKQASPIGNPPQLTHTFIPPNMKLALQHPHIVDEHIAEEVQAGHMSSLFTLDETHIIFNGHFRTSSLGITEKELGNRKFHLIMNLSKRDADSISVNNMLNSDDFPTRWGSAWVIKQYVSIMTIIPFCIVHPSFLGHRSSANRTHTHI
jgi:hypothetical protein